MTGVLGKLLAGALIVMAGHAALKNSAAASDGIPTPAEYVAHVGEKARIVTPGNLKLDGIRVMCGRRPTVLDPTLEDYGAAYPGFLILNPDKVGNLPTPVKLWIYAHECAHQFRGPDEETADCFAVQRGKRQGWLTSDGVKQICEFISPAKGDSMHFSGAERCEIMTRCFASKKIW